jgi:hypothetical protein
MEKRKITAREVMKDLRAGVIDHDLMDKYQLSAQGLQSVFAKLVKAGVITQSELDDRVPASERTVDLGLFICPACGNIQGREFTQCPRCDFIVPDKSKLIRREPKDLKRTTSTITTIVEKTPHEPPPAISRAPEPTVQAPLESFNNLSRVVTYAKILSIAGFVGYLLVIAGFLIIPHVSESVPALATNQMLVVFGLLGIPVIILAFVFLVILRALSESLSLFLSISGALVNKGLFRS